MNCSLNFSDVQDGYEAKLFIDELEEFCEDDFEYMALHNEYGFEEFTRVMDILRERKERIDNKILGWVEEKEKVEHE